MRLLIDTNVFLEILLDRQNAAEAAVLLARSGEHDLFTSDFAVHSICTFLVRCRDIELLRRFIADTLESGSIKVLSIDTGDLRGVLDLIDRLGLDFDDAYQYTLAEREALEIVSFDAHFDHVPKGRKTPHQIPQVG